MGTIFLYDELCLYRSKRIVFVIVSVVVSDKTIIWY